MNTTPAIGTKVQAVTTTRTEQSVVVEVSAIDRETDEGWYVWGYRRHRGTRPRQTAFPQLYFVGRAS